MSEPLLAWHFVDKTLRDGRPIPADGELLQHVGTVVPCKRGLHASVKLLDALRFAPGTTLCRVRLSGTIKEHDGNKHAASKRTILWRIDARELLKKFARECALDVIDFWKTPAVVRTFLETGDPSLANAAAYAANAAAYAANATANAAVDAAAYAAYAVDAAAYAAAYAVDAAAYAAAYDAAYAADASAKQNDRLMAMVMEYATSLGYALKEVA